MVCNVFMAVAETALMAGIGIAALKTKIMSVNDIPVLSRLTLDIFIPMLTFSVITENFSYDKLGEFWLMPLLGFGIMLAGALAGFPLKKLLNTDTASRQAAFHHMCAMNNYMLLPLIVLESTFSGRHTALLLVMNVGSTIGFWTIGVITLAGIHRESMVNSIKNVWSANIIAVLAALAVSMLKIPVPEIIARAAAAFGKISVPLTVFITGAALCSGFSSLIRHKRDAVYMTLVRLLLLPLLTIMLLKLLPLPQDVYETCFVVALMPGSVTSALVGKKYGGDEAFIMQSIIITTILSLGSIPLLMKLM